MIALLAMTSFASAATVQVELSVEQASALTRAQVESVVWHALARDLGQDAVFVEPGQNSDTPIDRWRMEVTWDPQVLHIDGHLFATLAPRVRVDTGSGERQWLGTALVLDHAQHGWVSLPDAALMRTLDRAAPALERPAWHEIATVEPLNLVVAVDEELREKWGAEWMLRAAERVEHANLLLQRAHVELHVVGFEAMRSRDDSGLHDMLRALDRMPRPEGAALRIGLTGQIVADTASDVEDVAVAYVPGSTILLADQVPALASLHRWDAAEEGTALAHEVLHALGIPHLEAPGQLMSEFKAGMLYDLSPTAVELAETAMFARGTHDSLRAVLALGQAADQITDPAEAMAYITHNLAAGIGVPDPGLVDPDRLTPLTNVALGRYYLRQAATSPDQADRFRRTAALHSRAAIASIHPQDDWTPLLREFASALCDESPWRDTSGGAVCSEVALPPLESRGLTPRIIEVSD
ncbi:MAG: hypothetical protein KC912_09400 [Proteobacteria bacterium]|nr:hypothetical protein [Pseudomonadota bacterium]